MAKIIFHLYFCHFPSYDVLFSKYMLEWDTEYNNNNTYLGLKVMARVFQEHMPCLVPGNIKILDRWAKERLPKSMLNY